MGLSGLRRWVRSKSLQTVAWLLAIGFLTYRLSPQASSAFGAGSVGKEMPALELRTLEGTPISRDSYRGKVVLVNFWASWCGPCTHEMPAFQRVFEEKKARGFVVLGIWTKDTDVFATHDLLRQGAITYPIAIGTEEVLRDFGGVWALPTSVLIDRSGHIRQRVTGIFAEPLLRVAVERLLGEGAVRQAAGGAR